MGITRSGSAACHAEPKETGEGTISEEWVEDALVFGFVSLPRPPKFLCPCIEETGLAHCTLAEAGVGYRSA
jgi:hypothetical protein